MKRILALLLSLALACSMASCAPILEAVIDAIESELVAASPDQSNPPPASPIQDADNTGATTTPDAAPAEQTSNASTVPSSPVIDENGVYDSLEDVSFFLYNYGRLPGNYITKDEARALGWEGGSLKAYAPDKCIGGDRFGNYEGLLPKAPGRTYTECDIDTLGKSSRGIKRIVFSSDGLIFYTDDHYDSFELLYGEE